MMYKIDLPNAQSKIVDGFLFHWVHQTDNAPYLFFIPGSGVGAWIFENYFNFFHPLGYNIAAVDLPNRGGMPAGDNFLTLSIETVAKTINKAITTIDDIDSIIVVGHSLGALMAGAVACQSSCIQGLVLLAPSPPGQLEGAKKLPLIDPTKPYISNDYENSKKNFYPHIDDKNITDYLFNNRNGESPHLVNERFGLTYHVPWVVGTCPALVIEAELENPITHPPQQDKKVAEFYQADYILIQNMGHNLMMGPNWQTPAGHIHKWGQKYNLGADLVN